MAAEPGRPVVRRAKAFAALGLLAMGLCIASAAKALPTATGEPQAGETLYRRYCAVCHGASGRGDGPNAPFLEEDRPRDLTDGRYLGGLSDEYLAQVIRERGAGYPGVTVHTPLGTHAFPISDPGAGCLHPKPVDTCAWGPGYGGRTANRRRTGE